MWQHVHKRVDGVLQCYGVDDEFWLELVHFVQRRETLRIVHEAESARVDVEYGGFMVETQQVDEETAHFASTKYEYSHVRYFTLNIKH